MTVRAIDETWQLRAACRGPESALFFAPSVPEPTTSATPERHGPRRSAPAAGSGPSASTTPWRSASRTGSGAASTSTSGAPSSSRIPADGARPLGAEPRPGARYAVVAATAGHAGAVEPRDDRDHVLARRAEHVAHVGDGERAASRSASTTIRRASTQCSSSRRSRRRARRAGPHVRARARAPDPRRCRRERAGRTGPPRARRSAAAPRGARRAAVRATHRGRRPARRRGRRRLPARHGDAVGSTRSVVARARQLDPRLDGMVAMMRDRALTRADRGASPVSPGREPPVDDASSPARPTRSRASASTSVSERPARRLDVREREPRVAGEQPVAGVEREPAPARPSPSVPARRRAPRAPATVRRVPGVAQHDPVAGRERQRARGVAGGRTRLVVERAEPHRGARPTPDGPGGGRGVSSPRPARP